MDKCIYLPVKALAQNRYDMPTGPGEMDEPKEVLPAVGDKVSISLNGKVADVKDGMARIENLVSKGHMIEFPGKSEGSEKEPAGEASDDSESEESLRKQAGEMDGENS